MKHDWNDPSANGLMICKKCGAIRFTDIIGWHKTGAVLNGKRQPLCPKVVKETETK